MRSDQGFSLIEAMVALAILTAVVAGIIPAFTGFLNVTSHTETQSNGVKAAQIVLDELRRKSVDAISPDTNPLSWTQPVDVGGRSYSVVVTVCPNVSPSYCDAQSRQIIVEVKFNGNIVHRAETVFTALR